MSVENFTDNDLEWQNTRAAAMRVNVLFARQGIKSGACEPYLNGVWDRALYNSASAPL